jgi:hypothetical protein
LRPDLSPDTILWLSGLVAEAGVVVLCIRAKLFRMTPVFCSYLVWSLFIDILFYSLGKYSFRAYFIQVVVDSVFQLAVLVELEWAVLRPIRSSLPRYSIAILAFLVVGAGALIWPIARMTLPPNLNQTGIFFVQLQQTIAALRVVFFIAITGFSQVLSIGWRNRELQIATGLGFYSMCTLAVSLIHAHQTVGVVYHRLDQFAAASYVCSLAYWIVSFAQQEQERQEFTPQMRSFLLTMTGAARGNRVALANSGIPPSHKPGNP